MHRALRETFRLHDFRGNQEAIVLAFPSGYDVIVLKSTGGGRSLCFQLPALCTPGFTLVVSPLRTLMTDQIDGLRRLGLCSMMFHGDMDADEKVQVLDRLQEDASDVKFVYTSPEQLATNKSLLAVLKHKCARQRLQRIVLDEAHCVGMWGDTFRCSVFAATCACNASLWRTEYFLLIAHLSTHARNVSCW